MANFDKRLTVHSPIRGSLNDDTSVEITLPLGTEYFVIKSTSGAGDIHWSAVSQAEAENAATAWEVESGKDSGTIVAQPSRLWLHADGGAVVYQVFVVREGR